MDNQNGIDELVDSIINISKSEDVIGVYIRIREDKYTYCAPLYKGTDLRPLRTVDEYRFCYMPTSKQLKSFIENNINDCGWFEIKIIFGLDINFNTINAKSKSNEYKSSYDEHKHILERDHVGLSEEGYKRLMEMEAKLGSSGELKHSDYKKADTLGSIKRSKELLELMPIDIDEISSDNKTYKFKSTLRVTIEKSGDTYHACTKDIPVHGFGFNSKEAFEDFKEILTNLIVMVFDNQQISKHCKRLVQWVKNNVQV